MTPIFWMSQLDHHGGANAPPWWASCGSFALTSIAADPAFTFAGERTTLETCWAATCRLGSY